MPDAVVIGAGPDGLVAANVLADASWTVQVLEEKHERGSAVRSGELTLPGFTDDLFSSVYPLAVASPQCKRFNWSSTVCAGAGLRCRSRTRAATVPLPTSILM